MATVITIVNYNHTGIMIVHYDPKTFIVQATGDISLKRFVRCTEPILLVRGKP